MQHGENAKSLKISGDFSGLVEQYVHWVYRLMSVELFQVHVTEAEKLDSTLSQDHLVKYNPAEWFTTTEMIDTVYPHTGRPTEDDLKPLTDGIPVNCLPVLGPWPSGGVERESQSPSFAGGTEFVAHPGAIS